MFRTPQDVTSSCLFSFGSSRVRMDTEDRAKKMRKQTSFDLYSALSESQAKTLGKDDLQTFLRIRGKPVSGNKPQLFSRVLLYLDTTAQRDPVPDDERGENELSALRENQNLNWQNVVDLSKSDIPEPFSISTITNYLSSLFSNDCFGDDSDDNENPVNAGTKKPVVKGRLMYLSDKIHLAQFCLSNGSVIFRAEVEDNFFCTDFSQVAKIQCGRNC